MVIWWRVVEELFFLWHSATSSLYRKQHSEVTSAMIVRSNFKCPQFFIVHFGSKIIQLSNGVTEDRLAILFSSPKIIQSQFAGSSVIPNGTVAAQCTIYSSRCGEAEVGQVFDNTASNTGCIQGAATRLECILNSCFQFWWQCQCSC